MSMVVVVVLVGTWLSSPCPGRRWEGGWSLLSVPYRSFPLHVIFLKGASESGPITDHGIIAYPLSRSLTRESI